MTIRGHTQTLTWHDFPGGVPAKARTDAFTATSYDVQTNYTWHAQHGRKSDFRLSTVSITVTLNRARMWSRASAQSPELLRHEQGHYDITALVMRDLDTDLTALLQSGRSYPRQEDMDQAIDDLKNPAVAIIDSLQSKPQADGIYDQQTNHGRNTQAQQKWNAAITAARANAAAGFTDALRAQGIVLH